MPPASSEFIALHIGRRPARLNRVAYSLRPNTWACNLFVDLPEPRSLVLARDLARDVKGVKERQEEVPILLVAGARDLRGAVAGEVDFCGYIGTGEFVSNPEVQQKRVWQIEGELGIQQRNKMQQQRDSHFGNHRRGCRTLNSTIFASINPASNT